jgi:YfiH family protein
MQFELKTIDQWSYYHVPQLEKRGIVHGFMTRSSDVLVTDGDEKERFRRMLTARGWITMQQEHGNAVHVIESGERPRTGDGLVLKEKGVIGVIRTADCLPVILYEPDRMIVAVVHAGWRGTAKRIVQRAVQAMVGAGGIPSKMGALIGPGIGPCCYNVGRDVEKAFGDAGFAPDIFVQKEGTTFLDLRKANRDMLQRQGIREIAEVNLCTSCSPDLFFSARRDGNQGRQINFVQLKA